MPRLDTRIHPLTLRFPPGLVERFADEYFARTLVQVRLGLVLAIMLYALFGVLDTWIAPAYRHALWLIRYVAMCPVIAACLAFSYAPAFRRYKETVVSVLVLIMALGIIGMTAIIPAPGSYLYYAGLVLVIMYAFTLARLSIPHALAIAGIVIVTYVSVALWLIATPAALLINNLFFLVSSAILGFAANYTMERYARTNFLQRRIIELRTAALEQKTEELQRTNVQLVARNRELAASRSAPAASAPCTGASTFSCTIPWPSRCSGRWSAPRRCRASIASGSKGSPHAASIIPTPSRCWTSTCPPAASPIS